jgi:hypothetical protein
MPTQVPGIDLSGIDWYTCVVAAVSIAVMVYIMRGGRNRRRGGGSGSTDFNSTSDIRSLGNDISWGPGQHSNIGSDAGHHGGFSDGGGSDGGGGHH